MTWAVCTLPRPLPVAPSLVKVGRGFWLGSSFEKERHSLTLLLPLEETHGLPDPGEWPGQTHTRLAGLSAWLGAGGLTGSTMAKPGQHHRCELLWVGPLIAQGFRGEPLGGSPI